MTDQDRETAAKIRARQYAARPNGSLGQIDFNKHRDALRERAEREFDAPDDDFAEDDATPGPYWTTARVAMAILVAIILITLLATTFEGFFWQNIDIPPTPTRELGPSL